MSRPACDISVIIATVGRAEQLHASLAAYEALAAETPPFEVVVVLDGEEPDSRAACERPRRFPVRVMSQRRAGNGPAKNRGARAASGGLVVFLNDDTRPDPGCLVAHAATQQQFGPCIAAGRVEWDPEKEVTPYMQWLAPAGHQFNFSRLDAEAPLPWDAAWGAHLALPRQWALDHPFDPHFPYPSLEDIEWGYRVARAHLPMRYAPEAICYHDHLYRGPRDYRFRARVSGAAARSVVRRHPALLWALIVRPAVAAKARAATMLWPGCWRREMIWDLGFRWNYVLGILQPRRSDRLHRSARRS
jgi:GT2 family glycosyltransferase